MNKTILKKFTETSTWPAQAIAYSKTDDMIIDLAQEMYILREAAKDLMQPRAEAVSAILKMAKSV